MAKDKAPEKEQIKVTDKRIFTREGEIREEFQKDIKPVEPLLPRPKQPPGREPTRRPHSDRPDSA